jgi:antitoxin CcdA
MGENAHIWQTRFVRTREINMSVAAKVSRKPANISLPADLCADAKALGIDISHVCEHALREVVQTTRERLWTKENAEFIAEYNRRIEAKGTLLQEWEGALSVYAGTGCRTGHETEDGCGIG